MPPSTSTNAPFSLSRMRYPTSGSRTKVLKLARVLEKSGPGLPLSVDKFEYCKSVRKTNLFLRASNVAMKPKFSSTSLSVTLVSVSTTRFPIPARPLMLAIHK